MICEEFTEILNISPCDVSNELILSTTEHYNTCPYCQEKMEAMIARADPATVEATKPEMQKMLEKRGLL